MTKCPNCSSTDTIPDPRMGLAGHRKCRSCGQEYDAPVTPSPDNRLG